MMPGGKAGWAPATRPLFQAGESFQEESLAPLADDLPRNVKSLGYLVVTESFGGTQRYLGPNDVAIRDVYFRTIFSRPSRSRLDNLIV